MRLHNSKAGGVGSISGWGLKILHAVWHALPGSRTKKKKKKTVKNIGEDLQKLEPSYTAVETQNGTATLKNSLEVAQKLKYRT